MQRGRTQKGRGCRGKREGRAEREEREKGHAERKACREESMQTGKHEHLSVKAIFWNITLHFIL
jgi:hypothetical protein